MLAFSAIGSAVACAIAIQLPLQEGSGGIILGVRIGIHCGNARTESGDFGRTVIVAARLCAEARGGEVLVYQSAREVLNGAYSLGESRMLALKGLAGLHEAFSLFWQ